MLKVPVGQIKEIRRNSIPVFFYDAEDKNVEEVLAELETVDDNLESQAVEFVRCSDAGALDEYGLQVLPSLVHFEHGIPSSIYR